MSLRTALRVATLAALTLVAGPTRAAEQDFQLWPGIQGKLDLTERVSANLLLQLRLGEDVSTLQTAVVRSWLAAKPTPWLELAAGYDFIPLVNPRYVPQHRAWPQVSLLRRWAELSASNRTRLEVRFIRGLDETALRIRNATRLSHPLAGGPWYLAGANEFFFDLNEAGPIEPGFAENRFFLGAGHRFGSRYRLEAGYQMRWIDLPARDLIQHGLLLTLHLRASLR